MGELPTVAAPAAMANAVLDALAHRGGAPIPIPMTAEKVWRALHAGLDHGIGHLFSTSPKKM
ncbi:hypothetical protein, partial [Candidatus Entotheonella palauensis]|uniref:hypothetical protein n=1 Tax=Candidatus Entotheonella palauensis TaxID=93172 RepID=UPI0015C4B37B